MLISALVFASLHARADTAGPLPAAYQPGTLDQDGVGQIFNLLHILGDAVNQRQTQDVATEQACALLSGEVAGLMPYESNQKAGLSGWLRDRIAAQGQALSVRAAGSACAFLTGQGTQGFQAMASGSALHDTLLQLGMDQAGTALQSSGLPFTKRLELETGIDNGHPVWSATAIQPLWHDKAERTHAFAQLSWTHGSGQDIASKADTVNAGLALRRLTKDKKILYGGNVFFDHASERNHNRISLGLDAQTSLLGLSYNHYIPLSGWRSVDVLWEERAAAGDDLEVQGRVPHLPSWQGYARGFRWSGSEDGLRADTFGYDLGLEWSPASALRISAGVRNEQDAAPQAHIGLNLTYRFGETIDFTQPAVLQDVSQMVYNKVRRDNTVRVERRKKASAHVTVTENTGSNTAVTDSDSFALYVGRSLDIPFTATVSGLAGSVARMTFSDGAILTIGAGSQVRVEPSVITLITGLMEYVSGGVTRTVNVPGGTIELLGTDIDVASNGTTSSVRVREGSVVLTGSASGSQTLHEGEAGESVNGVVSALAAGSAGYIAHTDAVSEKIDRVAAALDGVKVAPYPVQAPRIVTATTTPGNDVVIGLKFNTFVTVAGGTPNLTLTINGVARTAALSAGSGSDDLRFNYTLQPTDAGASSLTVTGFDNNGATITGEGKTAVTTIADTTLALGGSVPDVTAPSGYAVAFTTDPITSSNQSAAAFQITSAEIGTTYNYTISSSGGGTNVTGSGSISAATQNVTGINVSGLGDGTLTVSLTLTDAATNTGAAATDTLTKAAAPSLSMNFKADTYSLNGVAKASLSSMLTATGGLLQRASTATYFDSSGVLQTAAVDTPRLDHDPITHAAKGLLIEASRINYVRNNTMQGAVVGTPGTLPTNWGKVVGNGLSSSIIAIGTDHGISYIDYRVFGTPTATSFANINMELPSNTAASNGQTWSNSMFLKIASGSATGFIDITMRSAVSNSGGVYLNELSNAQTLNLTSTLTRYVQTGTIAAATAGRIFTYIQFRYTNGVPVDITIRIGMPQLELAGFPSSVIPTSGAAVTRASEFFTIPTGSWYAAGKGTLFAAARRDYTDATQFYRIAALSDGSQNNTVLLGVSAGTRKAYVALGNNPIYNIGGNAITAGTTFKSALAYDSNNIISAFDGSLKTLVTNQATMPTMNVLNIGQGDATYLLNGYVENLSYYPVRLPDSEVQTLTQ